MTEIGVTVLVCGLWGFAMGLIAGYIAWRVPCKYGHHD